MSGSDAQFQPKTPPAEAVPAASSLYRAAVPGYPGNFSRDSFTYGLLSDDLDALRAQLAFSARHQGRRTDPKTGEEPGKIHHELPGAELRGRLTTYDACDTTALFLLALDHVARHGDRGTAGRYRANLERALEYVFAHLRDGVFYEDPSLCGADDFALKVTYWKDSELNVGGERREPIYPIAFSLVHFQYKAALCAAARLTQSEELREQAATMTLRGLQTFWKDDHFAIAVQGDGSVVDTPSSDSLHILLYLRRDEMGHVDAGRIVDYSEPLETGVGYLPALAQGSDGDDYHTRYVWVHEQALLHAAAARHELERPARVAERIIPTLDQGFPELVDPDTATPAGNSTQLWSIGAHVYFQRIRVARALANLAEREAD